MPPELQTDRPTDAHPAAAPGAGRTRRLWLLIGLAVLAALAVAAALLVPSLLREPAPAPGPDPAPPAGPSGPTGGGCAGEAPAKADGGVWQCSWSDEFDGAELSPVWELIPFGLGSACLFDDPEYVQVRDGQLNLLARALPADHWCTQDWGLEYGGGGIQSSNGFAQQYGRFEVRAKVPPGAGMWPAIWMLPDDDSFDGEIDIMEAYGGRGDTADATLHSPSAGEGPQSTCPIAGFTEDFHTYRLEWSPNRLAVFFDDQLCGDFTGNIGLDGAPPNVTDAFAKPYHVLLNLAVQPWWPPDASTTFPATMQVDYVRAWQ